MRGRLSGRYRKRASTERGKVSALDLELGLKRKKARTYQQLSISLSFGREERLYLRPSPRCCSLREFSCLVYPFYERGKNVLNLPAMVFEQSERFPLLVPSVRIGRMQLLASALDHRKEGSIDPVEHAVALK